MDMIKPARLGYKDTIGIIAPASSFDIDNFKTGVKMLRKIGFKVKYERAIFNKCWSRPGHNKQRARQINRMFLDKDVKAIFCAKAGYGSEEILPYLDKEIIKDNPKIFVGYSDITVLFLYLQSIADMVVFHGPVVSDEIYENMNPLTLSYLMQVLTEPNALGKVRFTQLKVISPGRAAGILIGGNLTRIIEAMGTEYEINPKDKILFLEDIGEDVEAINDYLTQLKRAGKFENVKGLIFGRMVDCFDEDRNLKDVLSNIFAEFHIPIISRFPSGHFKKREDLHFTLPLGICVTIDTDDLAVSFDEPAVRA